MGEPSFNLITFVQLAGQNHEAGEGPSWPGKSNLLHYQKLVYFYNLVTAVCEHLIALLP